MSSDFSAVLKGTQEYPDEDSEDLTDEEVASAIETTGTEGIVSGATIPCPECSGVVRVLLHELRRRKPHLYWRTTLECVHGHTTVRLFITDWL